MPYWKKKCGILDELGNILCLPTFEECPINLVTTNISEILGYSTLTATTVGDKTIYYTNKAIDQKI